MKVINKNEQKKMASNRSSNPLSTPFTYPTSNPPSNPLSIPFTYTTSNPIEHLYDDNLMILSNIFTPPLTSSYHNSPLVFNLPLMNKSPTTPYNDVHNSPSIEMETSGSKLLLSSDLLFENSTVPSSETQNTEMRSFDSPQPTASNIEVSSEISPVQLYERQKMMILNYLKRELWKLPNSNRM